MSHHEAQYCRSNNCSSRECASFDKEIFQLKKMPVFRPLISPPDFPTIEAPLELNPLVSPHDFG